MKKLLCTLVSFFLLLTALTACGTESKLIGTWISHNQEITFYKENRCNNNGDWGTWTLIDDNILELDYGIYGIEYYTIVKINSQELTLKSEKAFQLTAMDDDLEVTYGKIKN